MSKSASKPVPESRGNSVEWVTIAADQAGQRLDNFLLTYLKGVPRSMIYRIIRKGEVRINKARIKPEYRLQPGDLVRVPPVSRPQKGEVPMPGERLRRQVEDAVVYEDDNLLLINKPTGLAVHGGSGLDFGLIEVLRAARPDARFLELVHRLDRDTSGILMVAKRRPALRWLQDQIRQHQVTKRYHALVVGRWPAGRDEVDAPLLKNELSSGERLVRVAEGGKDSITRYRTLETFSGYTLVEAIPVTGRTHQIRVHCQFAGHPIAGDEKYMDDASLKAFKAIAGRRLMLHAHALEFCLPGETRVKRFEASWDAAFSQVIEMLRQRESS
ncbi:23S rRNA pseudouridine(955/2504/2580) synthase RluC [Mangrovitalea sediminis]|uniref:23S rRNA pseudouridine(955/2504/2580) synthase RluC n=1 Tax=Mangrovitalea sediminis TaxID=1982043 RepID=UPI000BE4EE74|nr:23S rRNA pseudouridine(955/2504/2580) synthase RluC [Mangrovitalea sediminis]